jgi:CMP-N-acetylneuraminic acid synthetase
MQPARMKYIDRQGRVVDPPFAELFEGQRRQDLPKTWLREGSVYLTRTNVLLEKHSLKGDDCRAWIIPPERAVNIDEPFDLWLAEKLIERRAA